MRCNVLRAFLALELRCLVAGGVLGFLVGLLALRGERDG